MPVFTPRGLKIRLDSPYVFSLIARLWSRDRKRDAFRVLKTCEGVEQLDTMLAYVAGLSVGLFTSYPIWAITVAVVAGRLVGFLIVRFGIFAIPGLVALATIMSYFAGYGIFHGVALVLLVWKVGWGAAVAWIAGFFLAYCVDFLLSAQWTKSFFEATGVPVTRSEVDLFHAYRLHAVELSITTDLEVTDDERASGLWERCLDDYARKYPEAVARFDIDAAERGAFFGPILRSLEPFSRIRLGARHANRSSRRRMTETVDNELNAASLRDLKPPIYHCWACSRDVSGNEAVAGNCVYCGEKGSVSRAGNRGHAP